MAKTNRERLIELAKDILAGKKPATIEAAEEMKEERLFSYAIAVLEKFKKDNPKHPSRAKCLQQLAFCTYKNPDLPSDTKFDKALEYLSKIKGEEARSEETYGLTGAAYKYKWQYDGQFRNLEYAMYYYEEGYKRWAEVKEDNAREGYTAINTAYLIDLVAHQKWVEKQKLHIPLDINADLEKAKSIRREIVNHVSLEGPPKTDFDKWIPSTLAEAHFGLLEFEAAKVHLKKMKTIFKEDGWQFESTVRQLATIAQMQIDFTDKSPEDKKILREESREVLKILSGNDEGVDSAFTGKVGLALSGGGFRASLYHIGVLAKLAELGILRHISVLSCVSGGSIVGAYYYLQVKNLLEGKGENANKEVLSDQDYLKIVERLEKDFLKKIKGNIRMKIFSNLWANFKFFFAKNYSRTHRLGELYEKELYASLIKEKEQQGKPILMKDLAIKPKLNPEKQNWQRAFKVPELIINATTLNTGHNWQFSTKKMGEPPANILSEINAKYRLRRMEYKEAGVHKDIRLGHVVAASSGVPGIFDPLTIKGLYEDVEVQLVDGGVHDNQGGTSLLQQECSILLVSDASGQLQTQAIGSANPLTVLGRTNNILMERVRESSFQDLNHRNYSGMIKALFFVHLTKALNAEPKDWIGIAAHKEIKKPNIPQTTDLAYGINPEIQQLVSEIRTDLDAFNEQEAYALMYSGYKMAEAARE